MRLNWSSLTKEQKQVAMLIVMGLLIAGALLYAFVVLPLQAGAERRQLEGNALREKLIKADLALKHEVRAKAEGVRKRGQLDSLTNSAVAPFGNAFAWVTEQLYQVVKETGVEFEGLVGNSQPLGTVAPAGLAGGRTFSAFTAQMTLLCNYTDLLRFLRGLEENNQQLTVTSLTIDRRDQQAGRHQVSLTLEWPIWGQPTVPAAPGGPPVSP
jgi:type II secretory pathway component PulM